jgi:TonB family protein
MPSPTLADDSKALRRLTLIVCVLFAFGLQLSVAVAGQKLIPIKEKKLPIYPPLARRAHLVGGDVQLVAEIDRNGVVTSVHGSGTHPLFCKAAEENLRQWKFGPFAPDQQFPANFKITFSYRMAGSPAAYSVPATVKWKLPERVEIVVPPPIMEPNYAH